MFVFVFVFVFVLVLVLVTQLVGLYAQSAERFHSPRHQCVDEFNVSTHTNGLKKGLERDIMTSMDA